MSQSHPTASNPSSSELRSFAYQSRWLPLSIFTIGGFVLGFCLLGPVSTELSSAGFNNETSQPEVAPEQGQDLLWPNKALTPEQVVELQMNALAAYRDDRSAIRQVFAFASPANKAVTGPVGRFEQMIRGEAYSPMISSDHWMAGKVVSRDGQATVLVTTIDADDRVSLYRFYLSKQTTPYEGCWMTDRVIGLFDSTQAAPFDSASESI